MQQNERKGAWTLFVAILIFGALVWGYGGYERDKAKRAAEEGISQVTEQIVEIDSTNYVSSNSQKGKSRSSKDNKNREGKTKKRVDSNEPIRDILGDPIKTK